MMRAAIVILNWNGKSFLGQFLPSVVQYSSYPDIEVVVADNASSDGSVQFVKEKFPSVRIIQLDKNYGFAGGYNQALKQVQSEYYILLNSDVEVTENWLLPVLNFMDENPNIAVCMPKLLSYHNKAQFEYAGAAGGFVDKYGFPFCRGRIFSTLENDNGQYDDVKEIFWATGACMFVKTSVFHNLNGFDAHFFAHMEEIDLCWRIKNTGSDVYYYPYSKVFHVGGGALPKENPHKTYLNFRNNLFLLFKNLPKHKLFVTLIIRLIFDGIAAFRFLFTDGVAHFFSIIKAHIHFYINIPRYCKYRKTAIYNNQHLNLYQKSIVIEYYYKGKRTFNCL